MDLYCTLERALTSHEIEVKSSAIDALLSYCSQNEVVQPKSSCMPKLFEKPSYSIICRIVSPKELPKRKAFDTKEGLAILIHAIAHIEFSAIDLALDAVYRFRDVPKAFIIDWLEVAKDEVRHFKMLHALLHSLGYRYGDFAVHSGLFEAAKRSAHRLLDRMAVIPRFYEATGLDVNPQIIQKLQNVTRFAYAKEALEILEIIYKDEIVHVQKGDRWFKWACAQAGVSKEIFFEIIACYGLDKKRPHINVEARKVAGFSCKEIKRLGAKEC